MHLKDFQCNLAYEYPDNVRTAPPDLIGDVDRLVSGLDHDWCANQGVKHGPVAISFAVQSREKQVHRGPPGPPGADFEEEVFFVAVAVCPALYEIDFVVDPLNNAGVKERRNCRS